MPDMLVKLYALGDDWSFINEQKERGIAIRKPIGPEKYLIMEWVAQNFSAGWAAEFDVAISNKPRSCFVAIRDSKVIGFACYDATALGLFGPIGVAASYRGGGTGNSLLKACLLDMKLKGYAYAIIGDVKDLEYYQKVVGAIKISDSSPGVYKNRIKTIDSSD